MALTGITDLDLEILMNLPDRDLLNYCSTNKDIYNMCNNDHFWRKRFIKRFGETAAQYKPKERKWKNHYMQVVIDLDRFSSDPWEFVKYILWSKLGAKYSYFIVRGFEGTGNIYPFLEAPEWVMTNFYLLEMPKFEYEEVKYPTITPAKFFEILSKDYLRGDPMISGSTMYYGKLYRY
jgi:hypothetical protein